MELDRIFTLMEEILKRLIQELETEKSGLISLIDQAVRENVYLHAHFHSQALHHLDRHIDTLRNLEDSSYYEKKNLAQSIHNLRKMLSDDRFEAPKFKALTEQLIAKKESELSLLNQKGVESKPYTNQIEIRLHDLQERKIKGFKIVLNNTPELVIDLRRMKVDVVVTIANISKMVKEDLLDSDGISKLRSIGFELSQNERKLTLTVNTKHPEFIQKMMVTLSRITIDAFYLRGISQNSYLKVY